MRQTVGLLCRTLPRDGRVINRGTDLRRIPQTVEPPLHDRDALLTKKLVTKCPPKPRVQFRTAPQAMDRTGDFSLVLVVIRLPTDGARGRRRIALARVAHHHRALGTRCRRSTKHRSRHRTLAAARVVAQHDDFLDQPDVLVDQPGLLLQPRDPFVE